MVTESFSKGPVLESLIGLVNSNDDAKAIEGHSSLCPKFVFMQTAMEILQLGIMA